jgi:hypothetical protein
VKIYEKYEFNLSQRALNELVRQARADVNRNIRRHMIRIEWLVPNLAWAMDDCELAHENIIGARKGCFQQSSDLASRYRFDPIGGACKPHGEEIAGHLSRTIDLNGPPLFLKRDNVSNQNDTKVNDVMAEHMIIPFNNPLEYPKFNGAVEEAQHELQDCLRQRLAISPCQIGMIETLAQAAVNELNHRPRPCLNGRYACQVFSDLGKWKHFSKRERGLIFDWLIKTKKDILSSMGNPVHPASHESAWRSAIKVWLSMNGYIKIKLNDVVSPYFLSQNYHN